VLLISLGCESFNREQLRAAIEASGRPVETLVIQEKRRHRRDHRQGRRGRGAAARPISDQAPRVPMDVSELVIGTICGGSDGTSGITANPAVGRAFDRLGAAGAACVFEETGELVGCEYDHGQPRDHPRTGRRDWKPASEGRGLLHVMGYGSFAPGNAEGGLTTQEEKSMGAYSKSGSAPIVGILKPGDQPPSGGLYLLDVVPDGEPRFGFPNISDNAEIVELIACGAHITLFTTGRGSVVGSAISPVIKVCANPETYRKLAATWTSTPAASWKAARRSTRSATEIHDLVARRGRRPAHEIRSAGPPGIHPHLQGLRPDRSGLSAASARELARLRDGKIGRQDRPGDGGGPGHRQGQRRAVRPRRRAGHRHRSQRRAAGPGRRLRDASSGRAGPGAINALAADLGAVDVLFNCAASCTAARSWTATRPAWAFSNDLNVNASTGRSAPCCRPCWRRRRLDHQHGLGGQLDQRRARTASPTEPPRRR
jgi:altronate dehydratase large subunit